MIWTTATQFIVIGMVAFCISFGVIYSLIFCYKSRRKAQYEENEGVTEGLLKDKFTARRKSTSLTSPPLSDSVVNPNYNGSSPFKVPQRHLRSTSASYSPTHYLSPHHRRNSTPTHPPTTSSSNSLSECSCCGTPRRLGKSKSTTSNSEHSIIPSSTSLSESPSSHPNCCCHSQNFINSNVNGNEGEQWADGGQRDEADDDFLSTHKCKLIPVHPKQSRISKLALDDNHYHYLGSSNQKSFSFGPIPAARKARTASSSPIGNGNVNPTITLTAAAGHPKFLMKTVKHVNGNEKLDNAEWEEKVPLLTKSFTGESKDGDGGKVDNFASLFYPNKEKEEEAKAERNDAYESEKKNVVSLNNNNERCKRKAYTPDLFKKENMVLEEIPYYNSEEMGCN